MLHYYRELSWKQHQNLQKENLYAMLCIGAVSYTHLDVYKRQAQTSMYVNWMHQYQNCKEV